MALISPFPTSRWRRRTFHQLTFPCHCPTECHRVYLDSFGSLIYSFLSSCLYVSQISRTFEGASSFQGAFRQPILADSIPRRDDSLGQQQDAALLPHVHQHPPPLCREEALLNPSRCAPTSSAPLRTSPVEANARALFRRGLSERSLESHASPPPLQHLICQLEYQSSSQTWRTETRLSPTSAVHPLLAAGSCSS